MTKKSEQPPVIGITTYGRNEAKEFCLQAAYVDAVRSAGGIPILLPPGEDHPRIVSQLLNGLILAGGGDIAPELYDGDRHPMIYSIDPERDRFELAMANMAMEYELPVLGICRGLQVLTVASGGDLVAHVPDQFGIEVSHRCEQPTRPSQHDVQLVPGSLLSELFKLPKVTVTSWHHQSARSLAGGWQLAAHAEDGVIEAIEHQGHPWAVAVQWHPEMSPNDPLQHRLFHQLVAAAIENR